MKRGLYGMGNLIAAWMATCKVSQINWAAKRMRKKEKLFQKCLKGIPKKEEKIALMDGRLKIPKAQNVAKKPGQSKRIKSARTR